MHACIHAYIHACIHTYLHTYRQTDRQTDIHTYTYIYIHMHTYIHIYTFICSCLLPLLQPITPWSRGRSSRWRHLLQHRHPRAQRRGSRIQRLLGRPGGRIPTGYCCKPNRWGWWGWDGGYIVLCLCGEDWLKHGNDAGMMAKDEDDEVVDIWMEWFSWKVWGSFLTCNGIGFQMYFFPLQCCWQVILKWQSEDSEGGRRASGGVFVNVVVRAPSPQKVSHRVNLLFHLLLQKLSFQRPDTSCDFLLQEPRGPADWKIRSWRGRPSSEAVHEALFGGPDHRRIGGHTAADSPIWWWRDMQSRKRCRFRWTNHQSICHWRNQYFRWENTWKYGRDRLLSRYVQMNPQVELSLVGPGRDHWGLGVVCGCGFMGRHFW